MTPLLVPESPFEWHEGPSIKDAKGVWWDLQFEGDLTFWVHRGTGLRVVIQQRSVESRLDAVEQRLVEIEGLLRGGESDV